MNGCRRSRDGFAGGMDEGGSRIRRGLGSVLPSGLRRLEDAFKDILDFQQGFVSHLRAARFVRAL